MFWRCAILKKEGEAHLKNKKLKQTAIFIGIFAAVILGSILFMRIFRPPPEPEPLFPTTGETTTMEEPTTVWEASTAEEESTAEPLEGTTEPTTVSIPTTTHSTTTTRRTTTKASAAPPRTTSAARPPATTTRTTTRAPTTTKRPTTTARPSTTARPPATTNAADSLIAYGIDYGKSIGLTYRPQLTQGGTAVSGATQQAIRNRLDQAKTARATEYNVWREGNTIYISTK